MFLVNNQGYTPLNNYNQPEFKPPEKKKMKKQTKFIIFVSIFIIIGVLLYILVMKP